MLARRARLVVAAMAWSATLTVAQEAPRLEPAELEALERKLATPEGPLPAPELPPGPLPPEPEALGCATPCAGGNLSASHPYYDVYVNCANGAFTARTGPAHSVTALAGAPQNVIFGGAGGSPGTSDISFFVHEIGTQYTNPAGGMACVFDPPDTLAEPGSVGLEQEWQVSPAPGMNLEFRQEVVAFGSTEADSGVRLTLQVTNLPSSAVDATVGLRWQIDYQNGGDDGPLYAGVICDPPSTERELTGEHEFAPAEIRDFYRIRNNSGIPIFSNVTSTTSLSGIPDTAVPDRLIYGYWPSLRGSAWGYVATEGNPSVDADSAVLYYFGYLRADAPVLAPGETFRRSAVIFTSPDLVDCGDFVPGCAPSISGLPGDRPICLGQTTTLDGSGLGLSNCDGVVDAEWSDGAGVIATDPIVDVSPGADTTYTLTVTCSIDPACTAQHEVLVSVERPPELDDAAAMDPSPCNRGLELTWTPARFFDPTGSGVYNVYRSEVSCADALLTAPLATGLTEPSWFDASTIPGTVHHYVVEAEDARAPTACTPSGPNNGGAVGRFCLAGAVDAEAPAVPAGPGIVLFAAHDGDRIDLRWDSVPPPAGGEHFHLLKALDAPTGSWSLANPEGDVALGFSETDRSSPLQFFDLRIANACEGVSEDEFPATR